MATFRALILGASSPLSPPLVTHLSHANLATRLGHTWEESTDAKTQEADETVQFEWEIASLTRVMHGCNYVFWLAEPDSLTPRAMLERALCLERAFVQTSVERCVVTQCISMLAPPTTGGMLSTESSNYMPGTGSGTQDVRFCLEAELWRMIHQQLAVSVLYPATCVEWLSSSDPLPAQAPLCLTTRDHVIQGHLDLLRLAPASGRYALGDWNTTWHRATGLSPKEPAPKKCSRLADALHSGVWLDTTKARQILGWTHETLW